MTSANVTYYEVRNKSTDEIVGTYRQHHYCKECVSEKLRSHIPSNSFRLRVHTPDEDEVDQEDFDGCLSEWIAELDRRDAERAEVFRKHRESKAK